MRFDSAWSMPRDSLHEMCSPTWEWRDTPLSSKPTERCSPTPILKVLRHASHDARQWQFRGDGGYGVDGGMDMTGGNGRNISPTVEFPYGFPSAGRYRIFIQMKHGNTVETGVFDEDVR